MSPIDRTPSQGYFPGSVEIPLKEVVLLRRIAMLLSCEWRAFLLVLPNGEGHELMFRVDGLPGSEVTDETRGA
jgi:hypothetical protein